MKHYTSLNGPRPGEPTAAYMEEGFGTVVVVFGAAAAGRVFVPCDVLATAKRQGGKTTRKVFGHSPPIQQSKPNN